jgi:3-dehydroquinate dehydratase-2
VLNPGAWGHYSYALHDAVGLVTVPVVEVHISNPQAREEFRHHSVVSGVVLGTIAGFGQTSYLLALRALADRLRP